MRRSIRRILPLAAALAAASWAAHGQAQIAPWQQPPTGYNRSVEGGTAGVAPEGATADATVAPSQNTWTDEADEQMGTVWNLHPADFCGPAFDMVHDRVWVRTEFLGWWSKGIATPPLLTTSPADTASSPGVLGTAGTTILAGDQELSGGFHAGERLGFGAWLGHSQVWGIEASYLQLSPQSDTQSFGASNAPILARPFFNSESNQQDSQAVNLAGQQSGSFVVDTSTELQAGEILIRKNLTRRENVAIDVTAGYRYQQLNDHLQVGDTLSFSSTQAGYPVGSVIQQSDRFDTRNIFQGGEIGLTVAMQRPRWTLETMLKVAVGQTSSQVTIEGFTDSTIPGQGTSTQAGGFLALPSNSGVFDGQRFSIVPELGLTWGWNFTPQLRGTVGYDLLYWTGVARPGDQIDLNLDPRQFPPPASTTATRPQFVLHTSDYWAQGINLGLDWRF